MIVHAQFHWTLQIGMILEWVAMTQQAFPPSEFGHGICGSIKIESVSGTTKGRASVHVYNGHVNGTTESIKLVIGTATDHVLVITPITDQFIRLEKNFYQILFFVFSIHLDSISKRVSFCSDRP